MKRHYLVATVVIAAFVLATVSCGNSDSEPAVSGLEDGVYFAQQDGFSPDNGWKYMVTIVVSDGKIADVEWNGANVKAGPSKIELSAAGGYPMVAVGGAQSEWYEQAALVDEYLIEVQDPAKITYSSEDGTTDAISGVSIHINEFVELAAEAIAGGPVGLGPYKDGSYSAEADEFPSSGWKDKVDITVISGRIVAAYWNPVNADGADKYETSALGNYGMVQNGGAQAEWDVQADRVVAKLLETQDPTAISWDAEGKTDAISGVSIHVNAFFELAQKALSDAR